MKTILLTVLIVLVSVLLLGIKVLFVKGSSFPSGHIGGNAALRKHGIHCASHDDESGQPKS